MVFSFSAFCSSVKTTAVLTWTCGCEPQPWSLAACVFKRISAALRATLSICESSLSARVFSALETSAAFCCLTKSVSSQWLAACQNYVYVQSRTLPHTVTLPKCFSTMSANSCFVNLFQIAGSFDVMCFFIPLSMTGLSSFMLVSFFLHFLSHLTCFGSICVFVFSLMWTTPK